jgi:hypothetical protein
MPLNSTQFETLNGVIRPYVDMLIQSNFTEELKKIIVPVGLTVDEVLKKLKLNKKLINGLAEAVNIPVAIRADWRILIHNINSNNRIIPAEILNSLKRYPNYNPFYIAAMKQYEESLILCDASTKSALISLRELYLEMTPLHEYKYGTNYNTFSFRIGNVPFNLEQFGPPIIQGEIQQAVESFINYRLELHDEYQAEIKQQLERQLEEKDHRVSKWAANNIALQKKEKEKLIFLRNIQYSILLFKKDIRFQNFMDIVPPLIEANPDYNAIDLQNNTLGPKGIELLFKTLSKHPQIKVVNIWNNQITNAGVAGIARYLPESKLTALDINDNGITAEGIVKLAPALAKNHSLVIINLGFNPIGDEGVVILMKHLLNRVGNEPLDLRLPGCNIGEIGAKAIADFMIHSNRIININIEGNNISARSSEDIESRANDKKRRWELTLITAEKDKKSRNAFFAIPYVPKSQLSSVSKTVLLDLDLEPRKPNLRDHLIIQEIQSARKTN